MSSEQFIINLLIVYLIGICIWSCVGFIVRYVLSEEFFIAMLAMVTGFLWPVLTIAFFLTGIAKLIIWFRNKRGGQHKAN